MDERPTSPGTHDTNVNTTLPSSNGPSLRRTPSSRPGLVSSPDGSVLTPHQFHFHQYICTLTIVKDSIGYGMKVSGDNPVYVQSVKEGGAAEKAGLRFGDKIIKVNGTDVTHSTHVQVVELIKASDEVQLTVQQRIPSTRPPISASTPSNYTLNSRCISPTPKPPTSPNSVVPPSIMNHSSNIQRPLHHHHSAPARDRITAPQPVDHEKLRQLECQREQTFRLMLEKEQRYAEALRSELAKCADASNEQQISRDLTGAERRIRTLQEQLNAITSNNFNTLPSHANNGLIDVQLTPTPPPPPPLSTLPTRLNAHASTPVPDCSSFNHSANNDVAPPLPSRNRSLTSPVLVQSPRTNSPPPLPPRQYLHSPISYVDGTPQDTSGNAARSPDFGSPSSPLPIHHQRTKSNPDTIRNNMSISLPAEENTSGSLCDLRSVKRSKGGVAWNVDSPLARTPPGTPPPPYHGTPQHHKENSVPSPPVPPPPDEVDEIDKDDIPSRVPIMTDLSSPNATIISMEDDDMSDQDTSQLGDLGPFKNMNKLMQHNMHLAVFLNYVLSNCDPSSLLFYLVTELYKEGNMKEMKKWAYEIHSSFLGPGAPLRLSNVDENIARAIDRVLEEQADQETKLRQVFRQARTRAKQELNEQLADFQQKKTAGLATIYGPTDTVLDECIHDKSKELKLIEQYLVPKMEPLIEELEKEVVDDRKYTMAAALGTIMAKHFGVRGQHFNSLMERCPTFVSKEKSLKARIIGRSRKVIIRGHQFVPHQFFTVTLCVHCHVIIWGIGPQGYQCSTCGLQVHRSCVKVFEESCVGPISSKTNRTSGISKFVDRIRPERLDAKRKPIPQIEKMRKHADDREESSATDSESAEKSGGAKGNRTNSNANSITDTLREADEKSTNKHLDGESHFLHELTPQKSYQRNSKPSSAAINRSESYKERISQKRPIRDKRKTSDPNLSKTNTDVEIDSNAQYLYPNTHSGSSSNSNSTRSLDSPSNSLEAVGSSNKGTNSSCENTANISDIFNQSGNLSRSVNQTWESDLEAETDPSDAIESVPPDVLNNLSPSERKRQDVINELFVTEESHVRALRVLDNIFYKPMKSQQVLSDEHLQLLFPNLDQILIIHLQLHMLMKARKKENPIVGEVGDILIKTFDGSEGESFKKAAATFCCRQKVALEKLKEKRNKKDSPLHNFLKEAESNPLCKRLQLQDIIPTEMQRLTKYPLLFENLAKYSKNNPDEEKNVRRALKRSKEILNRIDEAVREATDIDQIAEILRKLDMTAFEKSDPQMASEFRNLDFSKLKIIHQGSLNLKTSKKNVEVHAILLEDIIIFFQKAHEKYLLQSFPSNGPSSSPLIKVASMHISQNAVDRRELYLIEPQGGQMRVLVASSQNEGNKWFKRISETTEAHKKDGGKHKPPSSAHDADHCGNNGSKATETKENDSSHASSDNPSGVPANIRHSHEDSLHTGHGNESAARKPGGGGGGTSPGQRKKRTAIDPPRLTTEVSLIEPSQVSISQEPVLIAESVLTKYEILRRNCGTIDVLTRENLHIVANLLHVSKDELDNDSVTEAASVDKEPLEVVRGAYKEVDQLTSVLNHCLCVTEEATIAAGCETMSGGNAALSPQAKHDRMMAMAVAAVNASNSLRTLPSIPATRLQPIAQRLRGYLATLVTLWTEREEERERQRLELQRCREQLHAMHEEQQRLQRANESNVQESSPAAVASENVAEEPLKPGP